MIHRNAILLGILAGTAVLALIYGAFAVESLPTGKVSASLVSYSTFSTVVGFLVVAMAILALRHSNKKAHSLA